MRARRALLWLAQALWALLMVAASAALIAAWLIDRAISRCNGG